jgi:hypothetical protein
MIRVVAILETMWEGAIPQPVARRQSGVYCWRNALTQKGNNILDESGVEGVPLAIKWSCSISTSYG